jgi:UDP-glucose 4-epimerase
MIHAFENLIRRPIPHKIVDRRQGDVKICFADVSKSYNELNWFTQKGIYEMCEDLWKWKVNNPNGYKKNCI